MAGYYHNPGEIPIMNQTVLEDIQEVLAVRVTLKNRLLLVAAGGDMIDCAGVYDAERTDHGGTITENWQVGKKVDLTL